MIAIIDYGMGNLGSMLNMFMRIGVQSKIVSDPALLVAAKKIVLPGVGAFDTAMTRINCSPGLREMLNYKVLTQRVPILGVCLGMQLLTQSSEEGFLPGLGWIPGKTIRFPKFDGLKVPHMGWNIAHLNTPSKLTSEVESCSRYYFVHSYFVQVDNLNNSLMRTQYGIEFDSAIGFENIFGVQFHPEKSHRYGMQLLKCFAKL